MIVIAGGGIAGLATAIALSPVADIVVLERRGTLASNEGAGIQLSPNAMKALTALGVDAAVRAVAHQPEGLSIFSGTRAVTRVPYDAAFEARFGAPSLTVGRAALHEALLEEVARRANVTLVADRPVVHVEHSGHGWRALNAGPPVEAATWLIAADGVNSTVRAAIVGDAAEDTGWVAWRSSSTSDTGCDADTILSMAPGAHLVRYGMAPEGASSPANAVYIARADHGRPGGPQDRLATVAHGLREWVPWPIKVRRRLVFRAGATAFVGDAAHAMKPFLAQGAAMALEDAAILGRAAKRFGLTEEALSAYATARARRVRRVVNASDSQGGLYHMAPPMSFARNLAIARLGARGVLARVNWLYRWVPQLAYDQN